MRLLIKLASRSRPVQLLSIVRKYIEFANDTKNIIFVISLDTDDETVTDELQKQLQDVHSCIKVCMGISKSKIDAINRDIPNPQTFDILLVASDDMIPQVKGYDTIIREKMRKHYPDTDGVLFFNDGYSGKTLNTLSIMGRKYYQRFGYIYYPGYKSFYCDNEFMRTAEKLRKQTYFDQVIIRHRHCVYDKEVSFDALYQRNSKYSDEDKALYDRRNPPPKKLLPFLNTTRT
uniref:Glycosyltransferase n=1 Tax=viral metagenome TaxID=1070528 RepID=A0A6C0I7E7_9ZZZZ